jgi:hypothetical protein
MVGVIGFFVAAFSVILFAETFNRAFPLPQKRFNDTFAFAMYLLAGAFILWAVTVYVDLPDFTNVALPIGEAFLGAATLAMLNLLYPLGGWGNAMVAMLLGFSVVYRQAYIEVTAFVKDGLLHFNLQGGLRFVILALVLLVWLPALLMLVRRVVAIFPALLPFRATFSYLFTLLALATALFLSARRPVMIGIFFVAIIALFLLGSASNTLASKTLLAVPANTVKSKRKRSHGAKRSK